MQPKHLLMDKKKFAEIMVVLFEGFNAKPSEPKYKAYYYAVGRQDPKILEKGIERACTECKYLPVPAELRAICYDCIPPKPIEKPKHVEPPTEEERAEIKKLWKETMRKLGSANAND